jgi:hypothetical protein
MSSIKPDPLAPELRAFFFDELMPLRAEGRTIFPVKPDPIAKTYYREPAKTAMSPQDFEEGGCASVEVLAEALNEM